MSDLTAVKRAALARENAEQRFVELVLAAVDRGASYADVARAAGVTRQAVRQLVARHR